LGCKYRAGIIGAGNIANAHASGYKGSNKIDLVAIADPQPESLEKFGEKWNISKRYSSTDKMLDEENLDIISVCTWHKLHAPLTVAACKRRPKAVLVEKPMATSLIECDDMLNAAQQNSVKLVVATQGRFTSGWNEARKLLAEGIIGKVNLIVGVCGGGLENIAGHMLDYWRYAMGDPRPIWVMGNMQRLTDRHERGLQIPESALGVIGYSNNALGLVMHDLVQPSFVWIGGGGYLSHGEKTRIPKPTVFHGSEGIMEVQPASIRYMGSKTDGEWISKEWDEAWSGGEPHIEMMNELVDWVEDRVEHRCQAQNGRMTIEVIMAIYESARLHQRVELPLRTRVNPLDLMVESGHLKVKYPGYYDNHAWQLFGVNTSTWSKWDGSEKR
jgi:predicted dehydrogenase